MLRGKFSPCHCDPPWKVFQQEGNTFGFVFQIFSDDGEA